MKCSVLSSLLICLMGRSSLNCIFIDLLGADFLKTILSDHSFPSALISPIPGRASFRMLLSFLLLIFHLRAVSFLRMGCVVDYYLMALRECSSLAISVFFSSWGYLLVLLLYCDLKGLESSFLRRMLFFSELKWRRILFNFLLLEGLGLLLGVFAYCVALM